MEITFKGKPVHTIGKLPEIGSKAKDFTLVKTDLSEASLKDYAGKFVILNIFLSLDTSVCAKSVRKFNEAMNKKDNTVVLCISMDLPFALERFCGAEGLDNVISLSAFRNPDFGKDYGVSLTDGPLKGLLSRAVVVIDKEGKVLHAEQVKEIAEEPDYDKALAVVK